MSSTFDAYEVATTASADHALYDKKKLREYIRNRNDFIRFVSATMERGDLTDTQKVMALTMHPGRFLR